MVQAGSISASTFQARSQARMSRHHVPSNVIIIAVVVSSLLVVIKSLLYFLPSASTYSIQVVKNRDYQRTGHDMTFPHESFSTNRIERAQTDMARKEYNHQEKRLQNAQARMIKLVHVSSFYKVDNCDILFCPLDQAQSIAIASMSRARRESKNANVTLAASVFPEDGEILPADFVRLKDLSRSTATQYPSLNLSKHMPFVNDIFDNLRSSRNYDSFDYVIYTNADIIVRNDFYDVVVATIERGYDGFTINRQTVSNGKSDKEGEDKENTLYTAQDLDYIYKLEGKIHPGSDCFVMKRDIFDQIYMGDIFLGYPPIANMLLLQVEARAKTFNKFATNDLKATYHLGDDRKWIKGGASNKKYNIANYENAYSLTDVWLNICEFEVDLDVNSTWLLAGMSKHIGNYNSCTGLANKFWCRGYDPCKVAKCEAMRSTLAIKSEWKSSCPRKVQ
eukprot:CCRYP_003824-RA/>CCRYP_003824-RA protein AED:0.02 eAED:0.02 QI:107/1/1/1/1/1/2/408/448